MGCCSECNKIIINTTLAAGTESLNPEFIMNALREYNVLFAASLIDEIYSTLRLSVLDEGGSEYR